MAEMSKSKRLAERIKNSRIAYEPLLQEAAAHILALEAALEVAGEALESAVLWHQGDKWRDSKTTATRNAWDRHRDILNAALNLIKVTQ